MRSTVVFYVDLSIQCVKSICNSIMDNSLLRFGITASLSQELKLENIVPKVREGHNEKKGGDHIHYFNFGQLQNI